MTLQVETFMAAEKLQTANESMLLFTQTGHRCRVQSHGGAADIADSLETPRVATRRKSFREHLAEGLRRERLKRKWGQQELAVRAGRHLRHSQKAEAGDLGVTIDTLELICRALDCSAGDLLEVEPTEASVPSARVPTTSVAPTKPPKKPRGVGRGRRTEPVK